MVRARRVENERTNERTNAMASNSSRQQRLLPTNPEQPSAHHGRPLSLDEGIRAAAASAAVGGRSLDDGEVDKPSELEAAWVPLLVPLKDTSTPLNPARRIDSDATPAQLPTSSRDAGLAWRSHDDGGLQADLAKTGGLLVRGSPALPPAKPELGFTTAFRWVPGGLECVSAFCADDMPVRADVGGLAFVSEASLFYDPREQLSGVDALPWRLPQDDYHAPAVSYGATPA